MNCNCTVPEIILNIVVIGLICAAVWFVLKSIGKVTSAVLGSNKVNEILGKK